MSRIRSVSKLELGARGVAEKRAGCKLTHGTRKNTHNLPGTPDYFSRKAKVAVFIHGCFWHGCAKHFKRPQTNARYWGAKVVRNRRRDRTVRSQYKACNWRVITIWEHSLKPRK